MKECWSLLLSADSENMASAITLLLPANCNLKQQENLKQENNWTLQTPKKKNGEMLFLKHPIIKTVKTSSARAEPEADHLHLAARSLKKAKDGEARAYPDYQVRWSPKIV